MLCEIIQRLHHLLQIERLDPLVNRLATPTPIRLDSSGVISPGQRTGVPDKKSHRPRPASECSILTLGEEDLRVGHTAVTLQVGNEPAIIRLSFLTAIPSAGPSD